MEPTPIPDPTTRYQSPDDFPQPPDGCIVCTECGGLTLTATAEIHKLWHREI